MKTFKSFACPYTLLTSLGYGHVLRRGMMGWAARSGRGVEPFAQDVGLWHAQGREILSVGPQRGVTLATASTDELSPADLPPSSQAATGGRPLSLGRSVLIVVPEPVIDLHLPVAGKPPVSGILITRPGPGDVVPVDTPDAYIYAYGSSPGDGVRSMWFHSDTMIGESLGEDLDEETGALRRIVNLAINTVLYAHRHTRDIDTHFPKTYIDEIAAADRKAKHAGTAKARGKHARRAAALRASGPRDKIVYLGPVVPRESLEFVDGPEKPQAHRNSPVKHVVEGHRRAYWTGKKGSRVKVERWIHPHTRGSTKIGDTIVKLREPHRR